MKLLIIWNDDTFSKKLEAIFENATVVVSKEQLKEEMDDIKQYTAILLLCELNYSETLAYIQMQRLSGINVAKSIRLANIGIPVIFVSFLSRKQVYDNKIERSILNAIGHNFIQLPCNPSLLEETATAMQPLNDLEMYDIVQNYCDPVGCARNVIHSLNGLRGFTITNDTSTGIAIKIKEAIRQVYELFKQNANDRLNEFERDFLPLTNDNINKAINYAELTSNELIDKFIDITSISYKLSADRKWKILLLDDEITPSHPLITALNERNVTVICVNNSNDALLALEEDAKTQCEIMIVVSDYRLERVVEEVKLHQPIQGYRFLQELTTLDHSDNPVLPFKPFVRMVAFSALPRKFLMKSFSNFGLRVDIFSKKDYLDNTKTIDLLCNNLIEIGNEQAEATVRLPGLFSEKWALFEPFYRHHRNSNGYKQKEEYINEKARLYCLGIMENKYPFDLDNYTALNLDAEKATPGNEKYYTIFINKMICRRVALWFTQQYKTRDIQTIHRIIRGNQYTGKETLITAKNQIYTNLALSLDDFPWNLTIEEKRWLVFEMNIPYIDELEKEELAIIQRMNQKIDTWIEDNKLKNKLHTYNLAGTCESGKLFLPKFSSIRIFLFKLIPVVSNSNKHIASLQSLVISLQSQIPACFISQNVEKISAYLRLFGSRLSAAKPIKNETIVISNQDIFLEDIVSMAWKGMNETDKLAFFTNAYLFYNEQQIDKTKLRSKEDWLAALIEFHEREMKNYYGDSTAFNEYNSPGIKESLTT